MYKNVKPVFIRAMSGIHAGTGSDLGLVDLPIQRERHSGLPKIESSGVKGCIREEFEQTPGLPEDFVTVAFGPEDNGDKHAGSIAFTDARLLLFPVRSAKGVFAYATCLYILKRMGEDFALADPKIPLDAVPALEKSLVSSDRLIVADGKVVLEEYTFEAEKHKYAEDLARKIAGWLRLEEPKYVLENLIILPDDDFKDFTQNNTEIITRIKIKSETGTVDKDKGALFTEELLPTETVLYSLVMTAKIFMSEDAREKSATVKAAGADEGKYLLDTITEKMPPYIQLGGDATIGKGLCRVSVGVEE